MLYLMQLELRASEWNQVCWCVLNFDIAVFQFFAFLSKSLVSMPNKSYPRIEAHVFLYRMVLSKVEFGGPHAWNNSRKCMRAEITWCRMGHGDWKVTIYFVFWITFQEMYQLSCSSHSCFPKDQNFFEIFKIEIGKGVAEIWSNEKMVCFWRNGQKSDPLVFAISWRRQYGSK